MTPNLEFFVRKPILEPRIRYIPLEEVNTNVSRFIYRKKCKNNPGFSRNQVLSRKIWFCQDFNESGTLSEKPRMAGSFQGHGEGFGGVKKSFGKIKRLSGDVYWEKKEFDRIVDAPRKTTLKLLGLPEVQ